MAAFPSCTSPPHNHPPHHRKGTCHKFCLLHKHACLLQHQKPPFNPAILCCCHTLGGWHTNTSFVLPQLHLSRLFSTGQPYPSPLHILLHLEIPSCHPPFVFLILLGGYCVSSNNRLGQINKVKKNLSGRRAILSSRSEIVLLQIVQTSG